jgi:predicted alpha/beta-fold hydrolase
LPGAQTSGGDSRLRLAVPYRAPWWLPGGHAQTLYGALLAGSGPLPAYTRRRWNTPDGDFIDVDRIGGSARAPLLVLFHGLEGGSGSHYARALAAALAREGWRLAVPHFRGCSGEPNVLARAYHSGDSEEIGWMLDRFSVEAQGMPLAAVGISLGANALLKWLGEAGAAAPGRLCCAVAVSAPLDLMTSGDVLGRGFNRLYSRNFLVSLKRKAAHKAARFPGLFDAQAARRAASLREFDDCFTAPLHGFRDTDDYWSQASAKPWLRYVRVPTLVLNARNDPFLPAHALPERSQVSSSVELEFPGEGGHVGFVSGPFPGNFEWFGERIMSFVRGHAAIAMT